MDVRYSTKKVEKYCTNLATAKKEHGDQIARELFKVINFLQSVVSLRDVAAYTPSHFHKLKGNRKGLWAIDINGRKSGYRLILIPIDEEGKAYPSDIDIVPISHTIQIIEVKEVSKHYE